MSCDFTVKPSSTGRVGINEFQIGIDNFKDMEFGEALKSSGDIDYFVYDGVLGLGEEFTLPSIIEV